MYETPILWLLLLTLGVACLGGAMIYGTMRNRKRTPLEREITEAGTRAEYRAEDRDER